MDGRISMISSGTVLLNLGMTTNYHTWTKIWRCFKHENTSHQGCRVQKMNGRILLKKGTI